jgi:hypothetical protein
MSNDYYKTIMANTRTAADQWNEFAAKCGDIEAFKKAFHLRPTKKGVTVVSTLEDKPMRGAHSAKTKLAQFLKELYDEELHLISDDDPNKDERSDSLTRKGFRNRKYSNEDPYQAKMINMMSGDIALKSFLKVDRLNFIASEFIVYNNTNKRKRLDIIGYDGLGKIFFFELKAPENKNDDPVKQVIGYLNRYGIEERDQTLEVLSNYPINSINTSDVEFHGYAVHGYGNELDVEKSRAFQGIEEPGILYFLSDKD